MKWPWRRRAELCEPRIRANSKLMELESAKEILAEIFLIPPADVEEMIQSKLEEEISGAPPKSLASILVMRSF